ncbi:MAG TPA: hypothetical protein VEU51_18070 [Candidatus Acidoferrales bacterium]|nr:hypothetical protein [Candidatus Acidoferrales bacterium]
MKRAIKILPVALLAFAFAAPAMAQEGRVNRDISPAEVANFDKFLDQHPKMSAELSRNPQLVDNPNFIANHPELHEFMQNHPGVREELKETPGQFMSREGRYEWYRDGHGITRHELGTADNYFDHHPDVYQALSKNPALIDNREFVENHPGLHDYLEDHPYARREFKEHPYRFIHREHQYDRHEGAHS